MPSAVFVAQFLLSLGDQFLYFLTALVPDLLVEIRAVFFFNDFSAFLTDRLVELDAMAIQWRKGATTRPWLAGMSQEPKCGVVGTTALIEWLEKELGP